jgi:predicted ATP-binding protein involved in virulence
MKLTRITLQDFRCFSKADFDLTEPNDTSSKPLDVVLLVGGNGSGKSSVLKAVSGEFTHLWSGFSGELFTSRDIRYGTNEARVAIHWQDQFGIIPNASFAVRSTINNDGVTPDDEFANTNGKDLRAWTRNATSPSRKAAGVITLFDVLRLIPPQQVIGPNNQGVIRHRSEFALAPTIFQDGNIRRRANNLAQWIVNLDYSRAKAKADHQQELPIWDFLQHALNKLLDPYTFEKVADNFDVIFRTPTGHVPLEALSDGFRSVFVIVTDLLLRLSLATEDAERVLEQEATCLVDEIDAHLHPKWQETVIPGLRAMFPNVQFICTTHSEIVVSTVEPKNVFRLDDTNAIAAVRQACHVNSKSPAETALP